MLKNFVTATLSCLLLLSGSGGRAQSHSQQALVSFTVSPYVNIQFQNSFLAFGDKDFWVIFGVIQEGTFTASRGFTARANLPVVITAHLFGYKPRQPFWRWDINEAQPGDQHTLNHTGGVLQGTARVWATHPGSGIPVLALMLLTIAPG